MEAVPPAQVPAAPSTAAGTLPSTRPHVPDDFTALVWEWLREPDTHTAWQLWHALPDGGR